MPTPAPDFEITVELVTRLVADQHPDLAHLPIHGRVEGWDNVSMRLGDSLAVRLPRRRIAIELAEREQAFLAPIAELIDIGVPAPVRLGVGAADYPAQWGIVPWFDGESAALSPPSPQTAAPLGRALSAIHAPSPDGLTVSPYRGLPLTERLDVRRDRLAAAADTFQRLGFSTSAVWETWGPLALTPIDVAPVFVHGDLHPRNVLTDAGEIVAIIDWGDMTPGDPATDLSAVWSLFDRDAHEQFWAGYGPVSPATHHRTKAWAIYFAVLWIADAGDVEEFLEMGRQTLGRLLP